MIVRRAHVHGAQISPDPFLFNDGELNTLLSDKLGEIQKRIERWDPDALLRTPEHDIADQVINESGIEAPTLLRDQIEGLPTQEGYSNRPDGFGDTMRQHTTVRRFAVPFTGDAQVFHLRATTHTYNPPRAEVQSGKDGGGELYISLWAPYGQIADADQIRQAVHAELDRIEQHLGFSRSDITSYQQSLRSVTAQLALRKQAILQERDLQAAIGFPVRRRDDAQTYSVPVRRKTITTRSSQRSAPAFVPEPAIAEQDFESVLRVLTASRNQLERTPSMTSTLTEEKIRDLLLVNLNSQFEGAAAGEVFNGAGKTDILIREHDRNIFIAECKIWKGPKTITDALDQLFSYLVWRDTRAALLLFIRRGQPTDIITKSIQAIEAHHNHKRRLSLSSDEDRSDHVMHANGDFAREIRLSFLPFVLPIA